MALEELNALGKEQFVARLGGVFEHSPWIAERAWHQRPFSSLEGLHAAMTEMLLNETLEKKLEVVRAHPELAAGGTLTTASTSEQARLGLHALSRSELDEMNRLNRSYREKFGFPCIVALGLHADRSSVMAQMKRRLANDAGTELATALEQIGHIARTRLERIVNG